MTLERLWMITKVDPGMMVVKKCITTTWLPLNGKNY